MTRKAGLAVRLSCLALAAGLLLWPAPGGCLELFLDTKSGSDVLTLRFDSSPAPAVNVERTGTRTLTVKLPANIWQREARPTSRKYTDGKLVDDVAATGDSLDIETNTNAIGFISLPVPGKPEVQIHVFKDPIGAKWKDPDAKPAPKPAAEAAPKKKAEPAPEKPAPKVARRVDKEPAPLQERDPGGQPPRVAAEVSGSGETEGEAAPSREETGRRPFYSVPYSVRAPARKIGPDDARPIDADQPLPDESSATQAPVGGQAPDGETVSLPETPEEQESFGEVARGTVQRVGPDGRSIDAPPADEVRASVAPDPETGQEPAVAEQVQEPPVEAAADANATASAEPEALPADGTKPRRVAGAPSETQMQEYQTVLIGAQAALAEGEYGPAIESLLGLEKVPGLPDEMNEEVLYTLADAYGAKYKDDYETHFETITGAWKAAMNANPESVNAPRALLNLGLANLKVNNIPEAKAYFNILKQKFPNDMNIPYISYYWGDYYYERGEWQNAADQYQYLVQVYPDSRLVRDASLGLARSLIKLGYNDQAWQIIDYIDKRWPRFYVDYPPFLKLAADIANGLGKYRDAKDDYWTFYNLDPEAEGNDIVLARLGDIYLHLGKKTPAREIYQLAVTKYPKQEGGLVAKMRLAEEGIYDEPTMDQMFTVFDRPFNMRPMQIYNQIIKDFPKSPLAPLAQLKLAMWYYWNKKYADALKAVQDFIETYPRSPLYDRAKDLGFKVFSLAVPGLIQDENYSRVIRYWEKYADILKQAGITDDTKMAVALSYWKRGEDAEALAMIEPYLSGEQVDKFSEQALHMALNIYVDQSSWSKIVELTSMALDKWKLSAKQKLNLDYALAMAYQNLGDAEDALPLWAHLAGNTNADPASRAYAMYYMAKHNMETSDLRKVFVYAQEAISLFLETGGDPEKIKDSILMSVWATEQSGRYREAIKWAEQYDKWVDEDNPDWAASRFRLATLYRKAGDIKDWERVMGEIKEKKPDTLYGRMASTALETQALEQKVRQFSPVPN